MFIKEEHTIVDIEDELKISYLDYAMSVIIGRALPDVRDGLKPVHRRILYAMHELGLIWNKPFKKSARIVGEVLGKYHPHGDSSVYDAICRMVQYFSLRYPLIDGQGNFGSVDGDSPAAMRYTEVRLARITQELLKDIEKETVDLVKNFDESLEEPSVLPAVVPNLLVNGSSGIAVGMATNIPPHNLNEVVNALIFTIDHTEVSDEELFQFIQGPDFPTGGIIYGKKGILEAYKTGKGIIKIRGRANIEKDTKTERETIIISQIPYQVNKAKLLEHIGELINEKKIEGISDLRDESDRDGMRIVIELKRNETSQPILNFLYKHTSLETSFGIIMLAVVQNQPRVLNLREILEIFISYRKEVIIRRVTFDLRQAQEKAHILEGLKKAVDNIDRTIEIIRSSETIDQAKQTLMGEFSLSLIQAKSILEMRLQRLTGIEREGLEKDLKDLYEKIDYYQDVLSKDQMVLEIIKKELIELQNIYKDRRLTEIVEQEDEINFEDTMVEEDMVVTVTHRGYMKRTSLDHYRIQKRKGCGVRGVLTLEEDLTTHLFVTTTHNLLFFFADSGRVFCLKIHEIPQTGRSAKGTPIVNLFPLHADEKIAAFCTFKDLQSGQYIVMSTKKGLVKRTSAEEYKNVERFKQRGIRGLIIAEDDKLVAVKMTNGNQDIFLGTRKGKCIRFNEDQIRPTGRIARGSRGILIGKNVETIEQDCELVESEIIDQEIIDQEIMEPEIIGDDEVVDMQIVSGNSTIFTVTENGFGKRTSIDEYRAQNRGGKGCRNIRLTAKNGNVISIKEALPNETLMILTSKGKLIWIRVSDVRVIGRDTQGIKLIELEKDDKVVSIALVPENENENDNDNENAEAASIALVPENDNENGNENDSENEIGNKNGSEGK